MLEEGVDNHPNDGSVLFELKEALLTEAQHI
jgi:hypothetical protein